MQILFYGTFDEDAHPRVRSLREGFELAGHEVQVVNEPLGIDTAGRVDLAHRPWRAPAFAARVLRCWLRLWRRGAGVRPDVVVVGYLGHFDVHLARRRYPTSTIVLDHMVSLGDTVRDRGLAPTSPVARLLGRIDRAALHTADVVVVDTPEQGARLPARTRLVVVPVAPPTAWFETRPAPDPAPADPVRIVFFGLFTPLQGTPTIGDALALVRDLPCEVTMIGTGQDHAEARRRAGSTVQTRWIDWVDAADLPAVVAAHHICLGIFGTTPKAQRVVPNKVLQGAAAGCAIVTSDTDPQRAAFGDGARYVASGTPADLARALTALVTDRDALRHARARAQAVARDRFTPLAAIAPLLDCLSEVGAVCEDAPVPAPPLSPNAWLRWELIRRELAAEPPGSVLELGMGQGAVGSRLAAGRRYVGVEPDDSSRRVALSRLPGNATVVTDLGELSPDDRFDVVCAFEVLEHIEHDEAALRSWAEHVEPGGRVLLSVPANQKRFAAADELAGHFRRYDRPDLERVLRAAGLEPVRIDAVGFPLALLLEHGRNFLAARQMRKRTEPETLEDRTAGSGRLFQPPAWAGWLTQAVTAPFRLLQLPFRRQSWTSGWVVVARRAPG